MQTNFKLDMTMMLAIHDALRRDAALAAAQPTRSAGWQRFRRFLEVHHRAEDDALWPVLRPALIGRVDDLALVDTMEAQHAALESVLEVVDNSLHDGEPAQEARAELRALLDQHLAHEEEQALPLVDRTLGDDEWMRFGAASAELVGADMPVFLPWVVDGAGVARTQALLGMLPEPVRRTYENEWRPAYSGQERWTAGDPATDRVNGAG